MNGRLKMPARVSRVRLYPLLLLIVPVLLGACGAPVTPKAVGSHGTETGGGDFPQARSEAVLVRDGQFLRQFNASELRERADLAMHFDNAKPRFKGWHGGIYFYPSGIGAGAFEAKPFPCDRSQVAETGDEAILRSSPYWFTAPSYMPAGTYETTLPFGVTCGGKAFLMERGYEVRPTGGMLMISQTRQSFFVGFPVTRDRLTSAVVNGRAAVLVQPLVTEGYGGSAVIVRVPSGLVRIQSDALPIAELIRIAQSMVR